MDAHPPVSGAASRVATPGRGRKIEPVSRYGAEYRVARSTGICAATGRPLEPGSACVAALCERPEDEGFDRFDFCLEAWETGARPDGLFSYWRTTVPRPDAKQKILVDDDVLLDLFDRLADDVRPQRAAFRFILALILMRKRRLRYVGRSGDGDDERWLMRPRGADPNSPPIEVPNPQLSEEDIRELSDQLTEILRGEF